ncbi:hypothetical protein VTO42DRAFT_4385 [Malbranchea cinnamomea]
MLHDLCQPLTENRFLSGAERIVSQEDRLPDRRLDTREHITSPLVLSGSSAVIKLSSNPSVGMMLLDVRKDIAISENRQKTQNQHTRQT